MLGHLLLNTTDSLRFVGRSQHLAHPRAETGKKSQATASLGLRHTHTHIEPKRSTMIGIKNSKGWGRNGKWCTHKMKGHSLKGKNTTNS